MARQPSEKPSAPKVPTGYGALLKAEAERLGIDWHDLAKRADMSYQTAYRVLAEQPQSSIKAAHKIRTALIAAGAKLPAVPLGDGEVFVPGDAQAPADVGDATALKIRRNLRRLRELAGYDIEGAADEAKLLTEQLLAYERGEEKPSFDHLGALAEAYGHDVGHFWLDDPPPSKLGTYDRLWNRRRHLDKHPDLAKAHREKMEKIRAELEHEFTPPKARSKK